MREPTIAGVAVAVGTGIGFLIAGPTVRALERFSMIDRPISRSLHKIPTPRGGGLIVLSVATAATMTFALLGGSLPRNALLGLVAALALGALGLADDRFGLGGTIRLVIQLAVGTAAVSLVESPIPTTTRVAGALAVVIAANTFNFMDGIDGMAGANGALFGLLGAWGFGRALGASFAIVPAAFAAGCLVFLYWNLPRARVFLGDCGSYAIPAATLILAVGMNGSIDSGWLAFCVAPWSAYIADVGVTLVVRLIQGHPPYAGHRDHLYQRLVLHGARPSRVVLLYVTAGLTGFVLVQVGQGQLHVLAAVLLAYVLAAVAGRYQTQTASRAEPVAR